MADPDSCNPPQLLAHPNVTCTPHLGASTEEAQVNVAKDVAVQVGGGMVNGEW